MVQDLSKLITDTSLLELALTHSSYTKDNPDRPNNERLEFFGDAVLKLVFSKYLFNKFENEDEGNLTKYRARLISDDLLSTLAESIDLGDKIIVGSSLAGKKLPRSILGDTVEAIIGAIYIDSGYDSAELFILDLWNDHIDKAIQDSLEKDYKSLLQEYIQRHHKEAPVYKTLSSSGPDHDKEFEVGVYLGDKLLGKANGNSKKDAGQKAAQVALEGLS